MRALSAAKYYFRQYRLAVLITLLIVTVTSIISLVSISFYDNMEVLDVGGGSLSMVRGYPNLRFYQDPSQIMDASFLVMLTVILAFIIVSRDRRFFVSLSVSRWESLLGSLIFLAGCSVALSVIGGFILQTVVRLVLMLLRISPAGGWSIQTLLGVQKQDWWRAHLLTLLDMVEAIGIATFVGYVLARWWKPLLIASIAFVAVVIVVATQLSTTSFVQRMLEWGRWAIEWIIDQLIPAMDRYFSNTNLAFIAARKIAVGVGLTALSYPVVRWMKAA